MQTVLSTLAREAFMPHLTRRVSVWLVSGRYIPGQPVKEEGISFFPHGQIVPATETLAIHIDECGKPELYAFPGATGMFEIEWNERKLRVSLVDGVYRSGEVVASGLHLYSEREIIDNAGPIVVRHMAETGQLQFIFFSTANGELKFAFTEK